MEEFSGPVVLSSPDLITYLIKDYIIRALT